MRITRRTRMVNDVPMEIIYRGMSRDRLNKLNDILAEAADAVYDQHYDRWDGWGHLTFAEQEELIDEDAVYDQHYDRWYGWGRLTSAEQEELIDEEEELIDAEFRRLCQRAASKAGWHANKRNRNNKKEAVK